MAGGNNYVNTNNHKTGSINTTLQRIYTAIAIADGGLLYTTPRRTVCLMTTSSSSATPWYIMSSSSRLGG